MAEPKTEDTVKKPRKAPVKRPLFVVVQALNADGTVMDKDQARKQINILACGRNPSEILDAMDKPGAFHMKIAFED